MSKVDNLTDFLTDVADAIRTKKGTTDKINPQDFSSEIANISTNSEMQVIGDGKTYLYISIVSKSRLSVSLYFSQTVANGVTIDWGDSSVTETFSETGALNASHTYAKKGDYIISLNPSNDCDLSLGKSSSTSNIFGRIDNYGSSLLNAVEIGKNITLTSGVFGYCTSLSKVMFSYGVQAIGTNAFRNCGSLLRVAIPEGVTSINGGAFNSCLALLIITMPSSITSIGNNAFNTCERLAIVDLSKCVSVPTLGGTSVFSGIASDCQIVVPDTLYDAWIAATNWSANASNIIKASEFNA